MMTIVISLLTEGYASRRKSNVYVIPSMFVMEHLQVSIGEYHSKYEKFAGKWEYFSMFSGFWSSVS